MLTRSLSFFQDQVGPLAGLFVGLLLTVGWIGLLLYGILMVTGY